MAKKPKNRDKERQRKKRRMRQARQGHKTPRLRRETTGAHPNPLGLDGHDLSCDDQMLEHPDDVKFRLATFSTYCRPGKPRFQMFRENVAIGPLGDLPDISSWAVEEFLYHGVPGRSWHPVEAYLDHMGQGMSEEGKDRLRLWKQARIGFYRIGEAEGDHVWLQEWDWQTKRLCGPPMRCISLAIDGVNSLIASAGSLLLSYVAPWRPEEGVYCTMGYGAMYSDEQTSLTRMLLGFRSPEVAAQPLPWRTDPAARRHYLSVWERREWYSWLKDKLAFPFHALAIVPPDTDYIEIRLDDMPPESAFDAKQFGVYARGMSGDTAYVVGLGNLIMPDVTDPRFMPLREYSAYREEVGPPPGVRDAPRMTKF